MKSVGEVLKDLSNILGSKMLQTRTLQPEKICMQVQAGAHRDAIKFILKQDENAGISAITGVDLGEKIELMYHIRTHGTIITIGTEVPKKNAKIESIMDLIPGANFHEREASDLLGVVFEGHLNPKRLILPEDWPENVFPLRRDALITNVPSKMGNSESLKDVEQVSSDERLINIVLGPQHPALIEPERFSLKVDGEIVRQVEPRIGYVHRGIEKATESRTYLQDIYLVERICGICNACHAACFCQSVEAIMGVNIPPRAKYLRTIILELNRIHSHMLLLGHAGLEIGYETLFHYMWRDREPIMDMMENLTGNRVIASFITIGGVRRDLREEYIPVIKTELAKLKDKMNFYRQLFENDLTIKMRTKGVGVLSKQDALKLCVVGPVARGSGVRIDVRRDEPYAAYNEIEFNVITYNDGDSWARLMVRLDEIVESINIIQYALDHLPSDGASIIFNSSFEGDLILVLTLVSIANFLLFLSGWSSTNPYSAIGATRVLTQLTAYDIPLFILALTPAFLAGSLCISAIASRQHIPFALVIPWAFALFIVTLQAELEKDPFDIPHAETEIVAGYETEYTGRRLAFLKLAKDVQIVLGAAIAVELFLGGPYGPVFYGSSAVWCTLWFTLKLLMVIAFTEYLTCVFARLRIDQVLSVNWKLFLPLSLLSLAAAAGVSLWLNPLWR